jgi:hypothetical protein
VRAALAKLERRIAQAGREAASARTAVAAAVPNALAHLDSGPGALEGKSRSSKKTGSSSAQVRTLVVKYFSYSVWYLYTLFSASVLSRLWTARALSSCFNDTACGTYRLV